jgi:carbamoyltransferase
MTITFDCTEEMKAVSPGVVHVDGTARPQIVDEQSAPDFFRILQEYHSLTGVPSLINTSFNMHEEPIVCTPADAVRAFLAGGLDWLAIGDYLIEQPGRSRTSETDHG